MQKLCFPLTNGQVLGICCSYLELFDHMVTQLGRILKPVLLNCKCGAIMLPAVEIKIPQRAAALSSIVSQARLWQGSTRY